MVKWTGHALTQLRRIHDYIAQDSAVYAKRVAEELVAKTMVLDQLPQLGRMVPELNQEAVRELGLYSYRIIYQIKSAQIEVLAVIHKRKALQTDDVWQEP